MQILIQSVINTLLIVGLGLLANSRLERVKGELQGEMDALIRRRQIYEKLAPALKAFAPDATYKEKTDFEEAYALAYIWAPDEVLKPLDAFISLMLLPEEAGAVPSTVEERRNAYSQCMLSMRKDAGYSDSEVTYRPIMAH